MSTATPKWKTLLDEAAHEAKAAREIAKAADAAARGLTDDERKRFDAHHAKAVELKGKSDALKKDADVLAYAKEIADQVGMPGGVTSKSAHGSAWAKSVADKMSATSDRYGVKALVTGSIDIPAVVEEAVNIPDVPRRLIDVLIDRKTLRGTNTYSYLRQTAKTNNAAPVPDGGTKPTSVYTWEEVEDRARVVAHLSEPIPERFFADHAELVDILESEMEAGVLEAIERLAIIGDPSVVGDEEHFTGLLSVSGTVAQAFATDLLTTVRKTRTALEDSGVRPTAWLFNSTDLESIDLMREDGTTGGFLVNESLTNVFGSYPRLANPDVPAGTAILGDWTKARLYVREDMRLDADRSGDNFKTNQVVLRAEGRFGLAYRQPQAFAIADLTAA